MSTNNSYTDDYDATAMSAWRHRVLIASALLVVVGVFLYITTSGDDTNVAKANAEAALGVGRATIETTAGANINASLGKPAGTESGSLKWRVRALDAAQFAPAGGAGTNVTFTAPIKGSVMLDVSARVNGKAITTSTKFVVKNANEFFATAVLVSGNVDIDGGPAVDGEALKQGAHVDASHGSISFTVLAREDESLSGRMTADGIFTVSSKAIKGNVLNRISVPRDQQTTNRTHTEVEHLDGTHYAEVATPDSLAMVKGTEFITTVTPETSEVEVVHGVVGVIDRFRSYVREKDVLPGQTATVEATPQAKLIDEWTEALTGPSNSDGQSAPIAAPNQQPIHEELREQETPATNDFEENNVTKAPNSVDTTETNDSGGSTPIESTLPDSPVTETPTFDATPPPPPTSVVVNPTETDGGTSEVPPPASTAYVLEDYTPKKCLPSHKVWKVINTRHLCFPRESLSQIFVESMGYRPLKVLNSNWGCMDGHTKWSAQWCLALAPENLTNLPMPYRPPLGRFTSSEVRTMDECYVDSSPTSFRWTDGLCHSRQQ